MDKQLKRIREVCIDCPKLGIGIWCKSMRNKTINEQDYYSCGLSETLMTYQMADWGMAEVPSKCLRKMEMIVLNQGEIHDEQ